MSKGMLASALTLLLHGGLLPLCVAASIMDDARWDAAIQLQEDGDHLLAAAAFAELFQDYPASQEAALRVARNQERGGQIATAIASYDVANAVSPLGYWAEVGLYYQAVLKYQVGDSSGAEENVAAMEARFPESRWTARAVALRDQHDLIPPDNAAEGSPDSADEAGLEIANRLAREETAWSRYVAANLHKEPSFDNERISALDELIAEFGDTRIALQALDTKGHLLIRSSRSSEAIAVFEELVDSMGADAANARIGQTAKTRLAALYHAAERRDEAYALYDELAETASDPSVASNAALQATGVHFEILQRKVWSHEELPTGCWTELRAMCRAVRTRPGANLHEKARADLMFIEAYAWGRRVDEVAPFAQAYLQEYTGPQFRKERAVAEMYLGESLLAQGDYQLALDHFEGILRRFEGEMIWPQVGIKARVQFRVFDTLVRMHADQELIVSAGQAVLDKYPNTGEYAQLVRNVASWQGLPIVDPAAASR